MAKDFRETRRIAEEITGALGTVRGAVDLDIDQEPPLPQLQISMNRDAIARYGLKVSDVADLIEVAVGGKAIAQLYQGDRHMASPVSIKKKRGILRRKIAGLMLTSSTGAKDTSFSGCRCQIECRRKYDYQGNEQTPSDGKVQFARS